MVDFRKIDKKWQKRWRESSIFEAKINEDMEKFYCLDMYPYPSGKMHMGHMRNYGIGDANARFRRMQGYNVLYPMGFDSFGLPAENAAIKRGANPMKWTESNIRTIKKQMKKLGFSFDWRREIASHKEDYYKWNQWMFTKFFEKGLVYRKKTEINWCPSCKTVLANEQVVDGKCERCGTEIDLKKNEQWFYKITEYSDELINELKNLEWPEKVKKMQKDWIGRSEGVEVVFKTEEDEEIPVFTTRPDTLYGCTFMALAPEHEISEKLAQENNEIEKFVNKAKKLKTSEREQKGKEGIFTGKYAINPVNNEKIPIFIADFVLMEYGTGAIMAVPAHDQRDFEFAKEHNIEIREVIRPGLLGALAGCEKRIEEPLKNLGFEFLYDKEKKTYFVKGSPNKRSKFFDIIQTYIDENFYADIWIEGKVYIIFKDEIYEISEDEELKEAQDKVDGMDISEEFSDLKKIRKDWENFPLDSFWNKINLNQAYEGEGILVNSEEFSEMDSEKARKEITRKLEKKNKAREKINYKLKDWNISRQRYWGTPIPIIYCEECGTVPVPEEDLPVKLPKKDVEIDVEGSPLEHVEEFVKTECPKCGEKAKRETDTLDTFIDSSWYFLRFCSPNYKEGPFDKDKAKYWMPVDQYTGGIEHAILHLMYARFFTKVLNDLELSSVREPFKKLTNQGMVLLEGEVMSKSKGNIVSPDEILKKYGADAARVFILSKSSPEKEMNWTEEGIEKSYQLMKRLYNFYTENKDLFTEERKDISKGTLYDRYYLSRIQKTIVKTTEEMENMNYHYATSHLEKLLSNGYKYVNEVPDSPLKKTVFTEFLEKLVLLFSPFAPHICNELWKKIGKDGFVSETKWPKPDESKIDEKAEASQDLIEKIREDIRQIKEITDIKSPKAIKIIVAEKWKYKLYKEVLEGKKLSEIMKKGKFKEKRKEVANYFQELSKKYNLEKLKLGHEEEMNSLNEVKDFLSQKLKNEVTIEKEEESEEKKAPKAKPGKPAIVLKE